MQGGLGAVAAGLLLGDASAALGFVGALLAKLGLLAMLGRDPLAALVELALALAHLERSRMRGSATITASTMTATMTMATMTPVSIEGPPVLRGFLRPVPVHREGRTGVGSAVEQRGRVLGDDLARVLGQQRGEREEVVHEVVGERGVDDRDHHVGLVQ